MASCFNTVGKKKKRKKKLKQNFCITATQIHYYMNHHKTGNPQILKLYAESKGNMVQVAGSGWSSPFCGVETAQMRGEELNSASKPGSVVLLVCLGEGGRERHSAAYLPEQNVSVSPFCFTG